MSEVLRQPAELTYADDLATLKASDHHPKPVGWVLSPQAVVTYIVGGTAGGRQIEPKYVGNRKIIETAVATLATDRALLLMGIPGTAKSWVSEHMAAAISGDSTKII
ncbi:MAG: AAA family ATPase, partial [Pirellula sp.]